MENTLAKFTITTILIGIIIVVAAGFLTAYFYGWHQNAVAGAKYDLPNLLETVKWIMGQLIALFSSHSMLNTPIPWLQKDVITLNNNK